ncbi:MAG: DUF1844 domain-containing protein [Candidatus Marinimicrobia bacterium]|jgi:hypothetical protein|nr:DUF1844 domain-containing protein [Candidatus Neomarinimicrobiota bacterium]MBT4149481.1 DUF1844 domain-containing protein [Candidatus Neomarinimicrobiota bacterium]MBT4318706.1 DUF1844 domain-containing protein [Candidatus Neomarinimicrobiota bacterium]MBT5439821.1 DUF1844 domain-containing protein [Candidatus Neomarinimicrobiota bacterium]MBT7525383.1 DUF1844 domain-containing protein [Candidatus Neomarinimicrobiota bacterium]|tara:strand:- start:6682 stop:7074 length:393 start_codon:yes stop_codon:yes gene_type:complete
MTEEQLKKEDQLFIHLVNTFVQSAWISLGKVKNPVSDKMERNLDQATYYIDLLDMLQTKMKGNLSEWEEQFIIHSLSELKLNFIDEQKKSSEEDKIDEDKESTPPVKKEKPKANKKTKSSKKSSKSKKEK